MTHELVYTSAPQGIRSGTTGYCTVAYTTGLPADLMAQLERLSRYRHQTVGEDPAQSANPVVYAHTKLAVGYKTYHVLSRVADTGLDHTGRSNYLAHHIAFGPELLPSTGPAWLCSQPRLFETAWDRPPEVLAASRGLPDGAVGPRKCKRWERVTGDAGWAGVLAEATRPNEPAYLIYPPGEDVLGLLSEAMALLPIETRWEVTFNTYFTGAAAGATCQWRCVLADSPEAREATSAPRGVVIRLDRKITGEPMGLFVEAARTGVVTATVPKAIPAAATRDPAPVQRSRPSSRLLPSRLDPKDTEPTPYELVEHDEPPPPPPELPSSPHHAGSGIQPLLVGIALGVLLLLVCVCLVEIAAGRSLVSYAGMKSQEEEESQKKLADTEKNLAESQKKLADTEKNLADRSAELNAKQHRFKTIEENFEAFRTKEEKWEKERGELQQRVKDAESARDAAQREAKSAKEKWAAMPKNGGADPAKPETKKDSDQTTPMRQAGNVREKGSPGPTVIAIEKDLSHTNGQFPFTLFTPDTPPPPGTKLAVHGLPNELKVTTNKSEVTISDNDGFKRNEELFMVTLRIEEGKVKLTSGRHLPRHPLLGLAVIEVASDNHRPLYQQFFRPMDDDRSEKNQYGTNTVLALSEGKGSSFKFNLTSRMKDPIKSELGDRIKELCFGQIARVKFIGKDDQIFTIDLKPEQKYDPGSGPPKKLEGRVLENKVTVTMRIIERTNQDRSKDGIIEISVNPEQEWTRCEIRAVDVVRWVKDIGYTQELYRLRDY